VRHSIAGEQNQLQGMSVYQTLQRGDDLFLIAGPCVIESKKHALMTARHALCLVLSRPLTTTPAVAAH
jgi:3-deoxy-D-manno-octulosonic acid (KDO) 8-phosphate synthase